MDPSTSRTSTKSSPVDASLQQRSSGSPTSACQAGSRSAQLRDKNRKRNSSGSRFSSKVDSGSRPADVVEEDSEENEFGYDPDSKIYMACIMNGQRLGVAYYDVTTREMFVMDAWEDGEEDFPCLQLIKYQAEPEVIFTSTKMDEGFVTALQQKVRQSGKPPVVKLVKSALFSLQQARHRLAYLQVKGMDNDLNNDERTHVLNSMINLGNETIVRAAGGLLAILQQEMLIDVLANHGESNLDGNSTERLQIEDISELSLYPA